MAGAEMKQLLKGWLRRLGYRVENIRHVPPELLSSASRRFLEFDDVVCRRMIETHPALTFVQVGAYDGTTHDPLAKYIARYHWRGILIEPQASLADRLREMYAGNDRVIVAQVAIDRTAGTRSIFSVDPARTPKWASALASFDRSHLVKHAAMIPGLEEMITQENVQCLPFSDVLPRLGSDDVDILQIDAEGADARILSLFPFAEVRPAIVHWEIAHLSREDRAATLHRLASFGYRFSESGSQDMLAVLPA